MCRRSIALATLVAAGLFVLTGCASTAHGPDGKVIARGYWPQKMTVDSGGTRVTLEPGEKTVDAATTVSLALVNKSPEIFGRISGQLAEVAIKHADERAAAAEADKKREAALKPP